MDRLFQRLELDPPRNAAWVSYQAIIDENNSHDIICAYGATETLKAKTFEGGMILFERYNLLTGSGKAVTYHKDMQELSVQFYDGEQPIGTPNIVTVDDRKYMDMINQTRFLVQEVSLLLPCPQRPGSPPLLCGNR